MYEVISVGGETGFKGTLFSIKMVYFVVILNRKRIIIVKKPAISRNIQHVSLKHLSWTFRGI